MKPSPEAQRRHREVLHVLQTDDRIREIDATIRQKEREIDDMPAPPKRRLFRRRPEDRFANNRALNVAELGMLHDAQEDHARERANVIADLGDCSDPRAELEAFERVDRECADLAQAIGAETERILDAEGWGDPPDRRRSIGVDLER